MEDVALTSKEHKVLKKFQNRLQKRFNVEIQMPTVITSAESDVIFVSINGETHNRERVKKFLSEKMKMTSEKVKCKENTLLITLSDSDEELTSCLKLEENSVPFVNDFSHQNSLNFVDELTTVNPLENSVCIIKTSVSSKCSSNHYKKITNDEIHCIEERKHTLLDDSVCVIESPKIIGSSSRLCKSITDDANESKEKREHRNMKNEKVRSKGTLPSSQPIEVSEICEVSSTTEVVSKKRKLSVEVECSTQELANFIPLHKNRKSHFKDVNRSTCFNHSLSKDKSNDDVIILDEPSLAIRPLRPVVIDGSNVAIDHGKVSHTFSAKGIQLAVDHFLNRGHTQVTAFVPRFRRFCNRKNFPTSDPEILDDLAKKQHVVFTPSRRLNGKCIASYDDRFIVQLASTNGGVIVSNDNYRDLVSENDLFKEVIEKRLLMFCFVGDLFMVPSDPLGRDGPTLKEFLSFPPDAS